MRPSGSRSQSRSWHRVYSSASPRTCPPCARASSSRGRGAALAATPLLTLEHKTAAKGTEFGAAGPLALASGNRRRVVAEFTGGKPSRALRCVVPVTGIGGERGPRIAALAALASGGHTRPVLAIVALAAGNIIAADESLLLAVHTDAINAVVVVAARLLCTGFTDGGTRFTLARHAMAPLTAGQVIADATCPALLDALGTAALMAVIATATWNILVAIVLFGTALVTHGVDTEERGAARRFVVARVLIPTTFHLAGTVDAGVGFTTLLADIVACRPIDIATGAHPIAAIVGATVRILFTRLCFCQARATFS